MHEEETIYTFTNKVKKYMFVKGRTYDTKERHGTNASSRSRWATVIDVIDDDTRVQLRTEQGRIITATIENFVKGYDVECEVLERKALPRFRLGRSTNAERRKNFKMLVAKLTSLESKVDTLIRLWS